MERNVRDTKRKVRVQSLKFLILNFSFALFVFCSTLACFAQTSDDLELVIDVNSNTIATPSIFKPNIDFSGRGLNYQPGWPQELAAQEVLETWQKDIGFGGIYRIQYNLWEIYQLAKDKEKQDKLLANYEKVIKKISEAGGTVILNIYGTPAGLGKVLDRKSPFFDFRAFKELVKSHIKNLSCDKRYNIWYEVWNAPDLDDFFLGRKQEYLNLYRAVGESIKELEIETRLHIPVGGPSTSWWFQNSGGNTILTPERSLIYELIKFCYGYRLPLDFITWHAYSTDPKAEKEVIRYNKNAIALVRDWLTYFHFNRDTPLVIDEWNFDSGANVLPERGENSAVASSYIVSRIKNSYDAGLNYQLYFSLEDFYNEKENVVRNVGAFWFDQDSKEYKGGPKNIYNIFKMLAALGKNMHFSLKLEDEFVGAISTKDKDYYAILIYNYIDPEIAFNYLSRNIARLNDSTRRSLLTLVKKDMLTKIMNDEPKISTLRYNKKFKNLLKKAQELYAQGEKFKKTPRNIKITIKNLKDNYSYLRYVIDDSCSQDCKFSPVEEKEVVVSGLYQDSLTLKPYSVNLLIFKTKPPEAVIMSDTVKEKPAAENITAQ
ncbi:MAG: hypothetical protein WAW67_02010 [Candidatus Omnitrophota bacterium]